MKALFERVDSLCESFFDEVKVASKSELTELFKLYDMVLTQRSTLSAMIHSAEVVGTHGSALVDGESVRDTRAPTMRTVTKGAKSCSESISPMPTPELWFETLLARKRKETEEEI